MFHSKTNSSAARRVQRAEVRPRRQKKHIFIAAFSGLAILVGVLFILDGAPVPADNKPNEKVQAEQNQVPAVSSRLKPDAVKAIYVTMHTAGRREAFSKLIDLADATEINAMVIDVKGSQGELLFDYLDAPALVKTLRERNIYTIARVVVFQDSGLAKTNPDAVIKNKNGGIWRDRRGFAWADPASREAWDNVVNVSKRALDAGFDEINYDYIRFPTDGNLENMVYPVWDGQKPRGEVIKNFSVYARGELKKYAPDAAISIDIFGYTFLRSDGLGIGQQLSDLLDEFDYVYPMVYPSHYSAGNFGFQNPAEHPYEVIKGTIEKGLEQLGGKAELAKPKIRPWLQVFDLGAEYTPEMIKKEINATYDSLDEKSTGWLLWDPSNRYDQAIEYLTR